MQQVNVKRPSIVFTPVLVTPVSLALLTGVPRFLGNPEQVYACKFTQPGTPA